MEFKNYSQNNEQDIILKYFNGKRNGTFLDIGANDGMTLSNVFALAKYFDWNGVFVEPSPKAFELLQQNYTTEENDLLNVAVGDKHERIKFYESGELLKQGDVALVSSVLPEELKRWESMNMPFEEIEVDCVRFDSLLHMSRYKKFDLLSIDIEGMELKVLPQIDFRKLGIRLAIVEWNGRNLIQYNQIMYRQGFRIIHTNSENIIYAQ